MARGTLSNEFGRFLMEAPRTGRYRLQIERIGYMSTTSDEVDLLPPDTVDVEMRIAVEAVILAPLIVTSDRGPLVMDTRLASWGSYDRRTWDGTAFG